MKQSYDQVVERAESRKEGFLQGNIAQLFCSAISLLNGADVPRLAESSRLFSLVVKPDRQSATLCVGVVFCELRLLSRVLEVSFHCAAGDKKG